MNYQNIIVTTCSIFLSILSFSGTAYAEQKIPPKNPVVFLLSSQRELYGSGKKTGVWLDALATPYYKLKDAGFDVVLASIGGSKPPIDPVSEQHPTAATKRFLNDKKAMSQFEDTIQLSSLKANDYIAIYLPGGHGAMWDFIANPNITILLISFEKDNKVIAAVDHGAIAFLNVTQPDGKSLLKGRKIAAFTKAEETELHLNGIIPNYADYSLESAEANVIRGAPFKPNAIQDGNIITGQNPASVDKVSKLLLEALQKQTKSLTR